MKQIHFIGGEKGGVGKSVVARVMSQYHIDRQRPFASFDGDLSNGALVRYYSEFAKAIDTSSYESIDEIAEAAAEFSQDVIVDLAAQSSRDLQKWMQDNDMIELANELNIGVTLWHVMDDGSDSVRLLDTLLDVYGDEPNYVIVLNRGRGADFSLFDESEAKQRALSYGAQVIELPNLHAGTMRKIDKVGASLWAAAHNKDTAAGPALGMLERQRVKVWLSKAYAQLDSVINPLSDRQSAASNSMDALLFDNEATVEAQPPSTPLRDDGVMEPVSSADKNTVRFSSAQYQTIGKVIEDSTPLG